MSRKY